MWTQLIRFFCLVLCWQANLHTQQPIYIYSNNDNVRTHTKLTQIYTLYQQCFACPPSATAWRRTSAGQERGKEHQSILAVVHWLLASLHDEFLTDQLILSSCLGRGKPDARKLISSINISDYNVEDFEINKYHLVSLLSHIFTVVLCDPWVIEHACGPRRIIIGV